MSVPHPDAERLVLAALPAEPDDPAVAEHLRGCAQCSAEVADLRRTVDLAREGGSYSLAPGGGAEPLPSPPDRVWHGITAQLGLPAAMNGQVDRAVDADSADDPDDPDDAGFRCGTGVLEEIDWSARSRGRRRQLGRVGVTVAAAVLGVVAGLGIGRALAPEPATPPAAPPVAAAAVRLAPVGDLDPGASGTVAMADDRGERQMVVQVRGVTNIAGGDHLEAWLMDASGTRLVPLGALDGGGGDFHGRFALPAGVPLGEFGRVDVSAERWDGNPGHSTLSVLRGNL